jgi:hypothetical protein
MKSRRGCCDHISHYRTINGLSKLDGGLMEYKIGNAKEDLTFLCISADTTLNTATVKHQAFMQT